RRARRDLLARDLARRGHRARGPPPARPPGGLMTIRVVLTDDHPVVRAGLRAVVDAEGDMEVVDELATAEELVRRVGAGLEAGVVLLDVRWGDGRRGGAQAAREVVRLGGPPALILTTYDSDQETLAAIEAGATGYLLKDA